jgi:hypothetical protein
MMMMMMMMIMTMIIIIIIISLTQINLFRNLEMRNVKYKYLERIIVQFDSILVYIRANL